MPFGMFLNVKAPNRLEEVDCNIESFVFKMLTVTPVSGVDRILSSTLPLMACWAIARKLFIDKNNIKETGRKYVEIKNSMLGLY